MSNVCSFNVCDRLSFAKGLCKTHYTQQRRGMELKPLKKQRNAPRTTTCIFVGCARVTSNATWGLCSGHTKQVKTKGVLRPLKEMNVYSNCTFEDCGKPHSGRGLCVGHYTQWRAGKPLTPLFEPTLECSVDGCSNKHFSKSLCRKHYSQQYREENKATVREWEVKRRTRKKGVGYEKGISVASLRKRDGDFCFYCNTSLEFDGWDSTYTTATVNDSCATLEHIVPISKGGSHSWGNVVLACWKCNRTKRNYEVELFLSQNDNVSPQVKQIVSDLLEHAQS